MSDGYDGAVSGGKGDGKCRKHHRKSTRTRSRQEKTSKPKLSILNVRLFKVILSFCGVSIAFFSGHVRI